MRITPVQNRDQWMPVITVKPDGTKMFAAWYDRWNDSNNSLIEVYGRFGTINSDGSVTFNANDFKITTQSFPPVFAGTLTANKTNGYYDPVYPPEWVNLNWHYPEWPAPNQFGEPSTRSTYKGHVGEYNGIISEGPYLYFSWNDYRLTAQGTLYARNQADIRLVRITWP